MNMTSYLLLDVKMPSNPPIESKTSSEAQFDFRSDLKRLAEGGRKGQRTKTAIQVAVYDCLQKQSLAELNIANICKMAKISQGTFYIHFPNRNALVADVLMRFTSFIQAKMRLTSKTEPERPARAATLAYTRLFEQNLGLMRCLLRELNSFPEARTAFQNLNREWLEEVVASCENHLKKSGHHVDNYEMMRRAYALGGMTDQYLAGLLLDRDPNMAGFSQDREAVIDTLNLLWERGMEP